MATTEIPKYVLYLSTYLLHLLTKNQIGFEQIDIFHWGDDHIPIVDVFHSTMVV